MSDHTPTITVWRWLPSACIFNVETIARFHAYQSVVVAVGEKLPCQREEANSEDLFAVAAS